MIICTRQVWIASTLTVLTLMACTSPQQSTTTENSPTPAATSSAAASPTNTTTATGTGAKDTPSQMKGYLSQSIEAVKANDFTKAKSDFKEFDESWEKVEDGVKEQSKAGYKEIEDAMDQVENTLVKPAAPDKGKAIAALESLSKTVETHKTRFK